MTKRDEEGRGWLGFIAAVVLGVPLLALAGLTVPGPPSPETMAFTLAVLTGVVGGMVTPWRRATGRYLVSVAMLGLIGIVLYRSFAAASGQTVRAYRGPDVSEGRWIDRLVPERDVAVGGSGLLLALGEMPPHQPGLMDALRDGYRRMRAAEGPVPSAVVGTFLLGQSPEDHTQLRVIPPQRFNPPEAVVVFLHGYMGNVTLLCWQIAQAAIPVGMDVVCPSTGWRAQWDDEDGRRTVAATIQRLRAQGVERIYLAGLSAGAIGISRIGRIFEGELAGVVLVSGASSAPSPARAPTLVLHGARDRMTPPAPARAYAQALGARGTYREQPEAGHWLILSHHEWVTQQLRSWLAEREGLGEVHR